MLIGKYLKRVPSGEGGGLRIRPKMFLVIFPSGVPERIGGLFQEIT